MEGSDVWTFYLRATWICACFLFLISRFNLVTSFSSFSTARSLCSTFLHILCQVKEFKGMDKIQVVSYSLGSQSIGNPLWYTVSSIISLYKHFILLFSEGIQQAFTWCFIGYKMFSRCNNFPFIHSFITPVICLIGHRNKIFQSLWNKKILQYFEKCTFTANI